MEKFGLLFIPTSGQIGLVYVDRVVVVVVVVAVVVVIVVVVVVVVVDVDDVVKSAILAQFI